MGKRSSSCLRYWATSQKVVGWNTDRVNGIFDRLNPSGHTMTLVYTQPLTDMIAMEASWGLKRSVPSFMCRLYRNSGGLNLLEPYGSVRACYEIAAYTLRHENLWDLVSVFHSTAGSMPVLKSRKSWLELITSCPNCLEV